MPFPNLPTQFKSGAEWRGNAAGRPKGKRTLLKEILRAMDKNILCGKSLPDGMDGGQAFGEAVIYHAIQGNAAYAKLAIERVDGPLPESKEDTGNVSLADIVTEAESIDATYDDREGENQGSPESEQG